MRASSSLPAPLGSAQTSFPTSSASQMRAFQSTMIFSTGKPTFPAGRSRLTLHPKSEAC